MLQKYWGRVQQNLTKTPETKNAYVKQATDIFRVFENEFGYDYGDWKKHSNDFLDWFKEKYKALSKASLRFYKASIIYMLEQEGISEEYINKINSVEFNREAYNARVRSKGLKTSAKKLKVVPEKQFFDLLDVLSTSRSKAKMVLIDFLIVNQVLALRPCEYWNAILTDDNILVIYNAKNTNGRSTGETREILIEDNDVINGLKRIMSYIAKVKEKGETQKRFQYTLRSLLYSSQYTAPKTTYNYKKKISLYSTRHQGVANLKFSKIDKESLAQILGHKSLQTATAHYAPKKFGRKMEEGILPKPVIQKEAVEVLESFMRPE